LLHGGGSAFGARRRKCIWGTEEARLPRVEHARKATLARSHRRHSAHVVASGTGTLANGVDLAE